MNGRRFSRRAFLAGTIAAATAAACGGDDGPDSAPNDEGAASPSPTPESTPTPDPEAGSTPTPTPEPTPTPPAVEIPADPFTLGVASGDPTDDAVILWTRLAPDPLAGGGMPDVDTPVLYELAADEGFDDIVVSGIATALGALGHSVHVDAGGLAPDTWYWYRFSVGEWVSPVGRTRTFPSAGASPRRLRFAFSSCQHWERGFYAAHRHMLDDDLDFVVWLGDYIYEYAAGEFPIPSPTDEPRLHLGGELMSIDDYRNRYAQYRSDEDLRNAHRGYPWIVTWDDHEVDNDYASATSENDDPSDEFLQRRAAGYQAWYEHMPVRLEPPQGPDYPIHRRVVFGDLAELFVLDTRQYRDDQPTDGEAFEFGDVDLSGLPIRYRGPDAVDPGRSILGADQEAWLFSGLADSSARWKVLAQQVYMFGANALPGSDPPLVITDTWDGYAASRERLLAMIRDEPVDDVVVLTGDFHSAAVADLKPDPFDPDSPVVASELMAAAISSSFPSDFRELATIALGGNPHIKYFDPRNGYTVCEVTPERWTAEFYVVDDVVDPASARSLDATFVIDSGTPGARST